MRKRMTSLILALLMLLSACPAPAEEPSEDDFQQKSAEELAADEMAELMGLDAVNDDDDEPAYTVGPTWHEMDLSEVTSATPVLYTCRIKDDSGIYPERAAVKGTHIIRSSGKGSKGELLFVGANWCIIRYKKKIGYIKRDKIYEVTPVDPVNTPPYGVQKSTYICRTAVECPVRKSMSDEDESWVVLNPGTALSIWRIQDGWAVVPYWRTYGYIRMENLTDLIPVSPTDEPLRDDTPIAAYTSFYTMVQTPKNMNRLVNIDVACRRLTRVMAPGESLDFNKQVGPYRKSLGYLEAGVLTESGIGYGGGTCQVSSTLYNALLQLPDIYILQRRPHGPSGARYLPHGVDAAVGNSSLNLRFRNDYDFPIRVEGHTSSDGALLMVIYRADDAAADPET